MPSPFPGMDPYLESRDLWPTFQAHFANALCDALETGDRYRARAAVRDYQCEIGEQHESYVEMRALDSDRLVTLLDIVSPANKTTAAGRAAYLQTRQAAKEHTANLVEIDLVLQGLPMLDYSRQGLPAWDHAVTVTRATVPERYEIYTATLAKRLPRFRVPIAADDRDTVIDLMAVFGAVFEQGGFGARIDYQHEPATPLKEESRQYLRRLLGLPSHEQIAQAAYSIWEEEGRPHGRDQQHWMLAIERLLAHSARRPPT